MAETDLLGIGEVDAVIRCLAEGTAAHTGPAFFSALVRCLASALQVTGAWVTEYDPGRGRLRAVSFWFRDHYITDFEYPIAGTPCAPVVEQGALFHVPENVIELYPEDPELAPLEAVSYLGLPLLDGDGAVLGHLAVLDSKPLPLTNRVEAVMRIFGARAAAEVRRLRSEQRALERERQWSGVLQGAWDAILVLDDDGRICEANPACRMKTGLAEGADVEFCSLLSEASRTRWRTQTAALWTGEAPAACWSIRDLELHGADGGLFPAEASLSPFMRDGRRYWALILRDLQQQREAERRLAQLTERADALRAELEELRPLGRLTGESAAMQTVFSQIRRVAPTDTTVLIHGETGTGKELIAQAIHEASPRRGRAMVRVNCGAIPAALMESEFFGHERGAFTGATEKREGRFALADGGTLFLDEIGELPLDLQVKLLRVLQEGEFEAVGSARTRKVNVRVVAATNRCLPQEIERGRFREDLYYRLNVFPVEVPPLRARGDDVILLAEDLTKRLGERLRRQFRPLSSTVRHALRSYSWPGNVRELENVLERAAILARGDELMLDERLFPALGGAVAVTEPAPDEGVVMTAREVEVLERANMVRALDQCAWRVSGASGAAALLGIAPSTLTSRLKALGILRPRESSRAADPENSPVARSRGAAGGVGSA